MRKSPFLISVLVVAISMTACASRDESKELVATFDGNECTLTGPNVLPIGDHTVYFIDNSEIQPQFSTDRYLDGNTYQDLIASDPAQELKTYDWVAMIQHKETGWDDSKSAMVFTYKFDIAGEYGVVVFRTSQDTLWGCGPLRIVAATSE